MLSLKFSRFGKKKQPQFRLIVVPKTSDPWGDYIENLGTMDPRAEDKNVKFNIERVKYWLEKGAQPTDTVRNLLIDLKIMKGEKAKTMRLSKERHAKMDEKNKKKDAPVPAAAPAAEAPKA